MVNQPVKVYTPEVITKITKQYTEAPNIDTVKLIAAELGVTDRSVIAKLSSLGVYVKKTYLNKRGEEPVSKDQYIERIGKLLDIDSCLLDSLEKVTKSALVLMESRIKELSE